MAFNEKLKRRSSWVDLLGRSYQLTITMNQIEINKIGSMVGPIMYQILQTERVVKNGYKDHINILLTPSQMKELKEKISKLEI